MRDVARKSILVIDDEPANRILLRELLEADDRAVWCASSGAEALKLAKSSPPDLILLDIMMPVMNGYEILRCLKECETTADIPVVMVTAMGDHESI